VFPSAFDVITKNYTSSRTSQYPRRSRFILNIEDGGCVAGVHVSLEHLLISRKYLLDDVAPSIGTHSPVCPTYISGPPFFIFHIIQLPMHCPSETWVETLDAT
jgi:hypothetical protein